MRLTNIIIGLLIMGSMITGLYSFTNSMAQPENYDVEFNDEYASAFQHSNNISNQIGESYQEISNYTANTESTIGIVTLVPEILILMKNMIKLPFSITGGVVSSLIEYLQLPAWTYTLIMTVVMIIVIGAIAGLILRYRYV